MSLVPIYEIGDGHYRCGSWEIKGLRVANGRIGFTIRTVSDEWLTPITTEGLIAFIDVLTGKRPPPGPGRLDPKHRNPLLGLCLAAMEHYFVPRDQRRIPRGHETN
jgi:hypothetical protein